MPQKIAAAVTANQQCGSVIGSSDHRVLAIILTEIAAGIGDMAFTGASLIDQAMVVDPELKIGIERALGPIGRNTARRMGKLLRRGQGVTLAGFRVERVRNN